MNNGHGIVSLVSIGEALPSISILKFHSHYFIVRLKPLYSSFVSVPEWAESAGGQCGHCMQGGGGQNKRGE